MLDYYIYGLIVPMVVLMYYSESKTESLILYFIFSYFIMYIIAYYIGIRIDVSSLNDTDENNSHFIMASYLFFVGYFTQKFFRNKSLINYKIKRIKNLEYIYDIILIILLIIELKLTSFDIFKGAHIYSNETKDTYFFEFINIIYVLYIANLKKMNKKILFFMAGHIFLAIADGHRLMGVTSALLIFLIYIIPRISKKLIPLFIVGAFIGLEAISMMRSGFEIGEIGSAAMREDSFSNHQGSVIYSTLSIFSFGDSLSFLDKLSLSTEYTLSLFLSGLWLPDELKFSHQISEFTYRPGGGMLIGFFYAFFGWIGPFLAGTLISYSLSWGRYFDISMKVPPYAYLYIILIPRYFVYTPIHIFKTILFTILLYYFIQKIVLRRKV